MKSGFRRKHFSRAWVLVLGYEPLKISIENPDFILWFILPKSSFGEHKLDSHDDDCTIARRCFRRKHTMLITWWCVCRESRSLVDVFTERFGLDVHLCPFLSGRIVHRLFFATIFRVSRIHGLRIIITFEKNLSTQFRNSIDIQLGE